MAQLEVIERGSLARPARTTAIVAGLILLPPFVMLALVPVMLFMLPVAIAAIPFMIPAFFNGALVARAELQSRSRVRPALSLVHASH